MRPVVIVGGGLAGLTLGILLRRSNVPVQLWEAQNYPRHRVCGEFISGAGARLLLKLLGPGQIPVHTVATVRFFSEHGSAAPLPLPEPGISVSRWALDACLAHLFERSGGDLNVNSRWTGPFAREGVVRAAGRRITLQTPSWTGLKVHAREMDLTADLEMHFSPMGYVGISRIPSGINLCALARRDFDLSDFRPDPLSVLRKMLLPETAAKLAAAEIDRSSTCAVSGLSFNRNAASGECALGDSIQMIPPFTGNGMSLAVESAFLAAPCLVRYCQGRMDWSDTVTQIAGRCRKLFRARFFISRLLRFPAERSWTRRLMLSCLKTVPQTLPICFRFTR